MTDSRAADATELAAAPFRRSSLLAGIGGYGWTALLQLVATPILIALLGAESFGVFGFAIAAQGVAQILDLGLSPTINREMARTAAIGEPGEARDFLYTIEQGYWILGLAIGVLLAALAPMLALRWAGASRMAESTLRIDVLLIAALIVAQWPISLYEGALTGLHRITSLHVLGISMRTAGVASGLLLLVFGRRELSTYLATLAIGSLCHSLLLARLLRRALPGVVRRPRRDMALVYRVWRFAGGMTTLALLGAVLIYADKLLVSRLLPLREFGYYTVAGLLASGLYVLTVPVFQAVFPVLSRHVAANDPANCRSMYHLGAQSLTVLVVPAAAVAGLFAHDILLAWTGNAATSDAAAPIARLLLVGTAINSLINAPYLLQLAHGRTKIGILIHVALLVFFVPLVIVSTLRYGATGAAGAWVGVNALYLLLAVPITHRILMRGEARRWLFADTLAPAGAGAAVAVVGWSLLHVHPLSPLVATAGAALTLACAWIAAAASAPRVRRWLRPAAAPASLSRRVPTFHS